MAIIVNVLVFFMQIFCLTILRFFQEHSLTSQVTFSRFHFSFLSDLCCSHSKGKLVANIKSVASNQKVGTDSRVGSAYGYGLGAQWFESNLFAPAYRSRAILPTLVDLFF